MLRRNHPYLVQYGTGGTCTEPHKAGLRGLGPSLALRIIMMMRHPDDELLGLLVLLNDHAPSAAAWLPAQLEPTGMLVVAKSPVTHAGRG